MPVAEDPRIAAKIDFSDSPGGPSDAALSSYIDARLTNRRPGRPEPIAADQLAALRDAAAARGGQMHVCGDQARFDELAEILGVSDGLRMFSAALHGEMMSELRWARKDVETTRDDGQKANTASVVSFAVVGGVCVQDGSQRFYFATDHVQSKRYKGLTPMDLIDIAMHHGLHYDHAKQEGVMFHLISALSQFGKIGLTSIGKTPARAMEFYRQVVAILDKETTV